jgi:hypothetical protein
VLIPMSMRVPELALDYSVYGRAITARAETWHSGMQANSAEMIFLLPPDGSVVHGIGLPPGRYALDADPQWWARGILLFFAKQVVEIRRLP